MINNRCHFYLDHFYLPIIYSIVNSFPIVQVVVFEFSRITIFFGKFLQLNQLVISKWFQIKFDSCLNKLRIIIIIRVKKHNDADVI